MNLRFKYQLIGMITFGLSYTINECITFIAISFRNITLITIAQKMNDTYNVDSACRSSIKRNLGLGVDTKKILTYFFVKYNSLYTRKIGFY